MPLAVVRRKGKLNRNKRIHHLPVYGNYRGSAPVSELFQPKKQDDHGNVVSFRGRRFLGKDYEVPASYHGYVLRSTTNSANTQEVHGMFSKIHFWDHDKLPTPATHSMMDSLSWLQLARVLHTSPNDTIHEDEDCDDNDLSDEHLGEQEIKKKEG